MSSAPARLGDSVTRFLHHPGWRRTATGAANAWSRLADVCYPLIVIWRGNIRGAKKLKAWWADSSKERRNLEAAVVIVCAVGIGFLKYGPLILFGIYASVTAYLGRDLTKKTADKESAAHIGRLQAVYNGLVPYLMDEHDPKESFKPGGGYRDAFDGWEFDDEGRLVRLAMHYSPFFKDGEAGARARVERALEGKIGQTNEYLYDWDEEGNKLLVQVLPPLPTGIGGQPWKVADIEFVVGFTDATESSRLIPVRLEDAASDDPPVELAPVVWRTGARSGEPHLLAAGGVGSGKTNLIHSLALQASDHGHLLAVIDSERIGEFGALYGKRGVMRIESEPNAAMELLEWVATEVERRTSQEAVAFEQARTIPPGARQHLWLFVDELPALVDASKESEQDPQELLVKIMRHGRATDVTVVTTCRTERLGELHPSLRAQARARIGLGRLDGESSQMLFHDTLELGGGAVLPPGRGYARIGGGPVVRLQVPHVVE